MKLKTVISMMSVLGLLSGTTTVLATEPGTHNHRATKGYASVPSSGKNKSMEKCTQDGDQAAGNGNTDSEESSTNEEKCKNSKGKIQKHDHRKMKNL